MYTRLLISAALASGVGCVTPQAKDIPVTSQSVTAGTSVTRQGQGVALYPGDLAVGKNLSTYLPEAKDYAGQVTLISIVPSVDTDVCEEQTHQLGESTAINARVKRVVLSRDLPMAQQRFAKESGLTNIDYLSDYKSGAFGKSSGLMMKELELLTRAVLVVDETGVIRYVQLVPEITHLPDMDKAIAEADKLLIN